MINKVLDLYVVNLTNKDKTRELIKTIHELQRLPKNANRYGGEPERLFEDGTCQRSFYHNLQRIVKKINEKYENIENPEYIEEELEKIELFEEIQLHVDFVTKRKKLKVKELCNEYNINIKKNKEILIFSYDEVDAKIRYLEDNGLAIIDEYGILNDIFFVSEDILKGVYGFTLEELFDKYIYSQVESRLK